jgi:hypothetical protein
MEHVNASGAQLRMVPTLSMARQHSYRQHELAADRRSSTRPQRIRKKKKAPSQLRRGRLPAHPQIPSCRQCRAEAELRLCNIHLMRKFRRDFQLGFDFDLGSRAHHVLELSSTVLLDTRG